LSAGIPLQPRAPKPSCQMIQHVVLPHLQKVEKHKHFKILIYGLPKKLCKIYYNRWDECE